MAENEKRDPGVGMRFYRLFTITGDVHLSVGLSAIHSNSDLMNSLYSSSSREPSELVSNYVKI